MGQNSRLQRINSDRASVNSVYGGNDSSPFHWLLSAVNSSTHQDTLGWRGANERLCSLFPLFSPSSGCYVLLTRGL
uniref:Zf-3CxxC domain-containing protein n=1 Tax=Mesocestoides corti TaxID=53468 RepID=A0A5K3FK52_MESCO